MHCMCHSLCEAGGYIGAVITLDDHDSITVLAVVHWKPENSANYVTLFEFLNPHSLYHHAEILWPFSGTLTKAYGRQSSNDSKT